MRSELRAYIDRAKARAKITAVVGRDVQLNGHKEVRCPFEEHADRHPSFRADDSRGRYKCFGCGRGGDHIDWLCEWRGLSFKDAVNELGKEAGLPPFEWRGMGSNDIEQAKTNREAEQAKLAMLDFARMIDVKGEAARHYASRLFANGDEAFSYEKDGQRHETTVLGYQTDVRGHSEDILKSDLVGWADGGFIDHLHLTFDERFGAKLVNFAALASGLVKRGKCSGDCRDFLRRGMYVYPVIDADGRVITITGKHPSPDVPNYQLPKTVRLNVRAGGKATKVEFPVWGASCYVLNPKAIDAEDLVGVEGEDDAESVKDRGGHEAVIGLRGSPSADQLAELARHRRGKRTFLAFDNDDAGLKYTFLVAEALADAKYDVRVMALPPGCKDIDDALRAVDRDSGPATFKKMLDEAVPLLDYLAARLGDDIPEAQKDERATRFAGLVLRQPPLVQERWQKEMRQILGASAGTVRKIFQAARHSTRKDKPERSAAGTATVVRFPSDQQADDDSTAVRARIDDARRDEGGEGGLKRFEVHRLAAQLVIAHLKGRGEFYHDGTRACFFDRDEKRLMAIERDNQDLETALNRYGLAPSEEIFRYLLDALRLEALEHGTRVKIHLFSHYDHKRNTLYLYDLDQGIIRITADGIDKVDNGTDGVVFLHNAAWQPFEIGAPDPDRSLLDKMILASIPFKKGSLTPDEQRTLFLVWFHMLFFPELFPTRPILALIGEAGSLKTFALRKVGRLLFGPAFNVMQLSPDPRDFDSAVSNASFVAIDNADRRIPWLEDRLAVVATGGSIKRRELYTTNRLVEFPVRASLAITSRTPCFRREDVADRLLLFHVTRLDEFAPESMLLEELEEHRNEIMTEVVGQLQEIVRAFRDQAGKVYTTRFRMADFASFALRIGHAQGWGDRMDSMLRRLASDQLSFALEGEPVRDLLVEWLAKEANAGRWVTVSELCKALGDLAEDKGIACKFLRSPRSLAQRLRSLASSLRELFVVQERVGKARRRYLSFRLRPAEEDVGEVVSDAS